MPTFLDLTNSVSTVLIHRCHERKTRRDNDDGTLIGAILRRAQDERAAS
jgi:hypothetical protein